MKGLNWVIAIAGVWEILAPFILGFAVIPAALWNNVIVGVILIVLGAWAALSNDWGTIRTLDWISAAVGLWLIISPFILGTGVIAAALWNDIIVGIIVLVVGAWAALTAPRTVV